MKFIVGLYAESVTAQTLAREADDLLRGKVLFLACDQVDTSGTYLRLVRSGRKDAIHIPHSAVAVVSESHRDPPQLGLRPST